MTTTEDFENLEEEQLPVAKHKLHNWIHFAGLYTAEHVAATEFVIGATFVALGSKTMNIILGLSIGNILALVITLVLACNVIFGSASETNYIENRKLFYTCAFICTIIYFVLAYWALKCRKLNTTT